MDILREAFANPTEELLDYEPWKEEAEAEELVMGTLGLLVDIRTGIETPDLEEAKTLNTPSSPSKLTKAEVLVGQLNLSLINEEEALKQPDKSINNN